MYLYYKYFKKQSAQFGLTLTQNKFQKVLYLTKAIRYKTKSSVKKKNRIRKYMEFKNRKFTNRMIKFKGIKRKTELIRFLRI